MNTINNIKIKDFLRTFITASILLMLFSYKAFASTMEFDAYKDTLKGKTIAVITGSTCEQIAREQFPESEYSYFETTADAYLALKSHKADAYLENEPALSYLNSAIHDLDIINSEEGSEQLATMFADNEKGRLLQTQYNEYVRKLYENNEIEKLRQEWIYGPEENRSCEDYNSLEGPNGTITVATDGAYPPFAYLKDNNITGYEIDILSGFCAEYGYKPDFSIVSFSGIVTGVSTGKFDIAASALSITPERQESGLFGEIIYDSGISLAVLKENSAAVSDDSDNSLTGAFYRTFIKEERWKLFASGILTTAAIAFVSILFGTLIGFAVYLLTRKRNRAAVKITAICKTVIQGFPMVVFLMVLYYVIFRNSSISAECVSILAFSLTFACSMHGMLENAESAIDRGQYEAAYALGYNENKAFFRYILPQAELHLLPNYKAEAISHLKATAIVGYVAVVDITKAGDIIRGRTYDALFPLIAVSLVYFAFSYIVKKIINKAMHDADPVNRSEEQILKGLVIK